MKALVTGSSGFVGSHLVEALVQKKIAVRVLLRNKNSDSYIDNLEIEKAYASYDDPVSLKKALTGVDIIFHVGGVTKATTTDGYLTGNAQTTHALLKSAINCTPKPKRFVLISSLAAAGPAPDKDTPIEEDCIPQPIEKYGHSKMVAELIALSYSHLIPCTIIRPPTVYGPRDVDCLQLFKMLNKRLNLFFGNAHKMTSIIYVEDLVQGVLQAALSKKAAHETYFLCNDKAINWRQFQAAIKKAIGKKAITIHIPSFSTKIAALFGELSMKISGKATILNKEKVRLGRPKFWVCANKKAKKEFGFKTPTSLAKGVSRTLAWYKENNWL